MQKFFFIFFCCIWQKVIKNWYLSWRKVTLGVAKRVVQTTIGSILRLKTQIVSTLEHETSLNTKPIHTPYNGCMYAYINTHIRMAYHKSGYTWCQTLSHKWNCEIVGSGTAGTCAGEFIDENVYETEGFPNECA